MKELVARAAVPARRAQRPAATGKTLKSRGKPKERLKQAARLRRALVRWSLYLIFAFYGVATLFLLTLRACDPPTTALQLQRRIESALAAEPYSKHYTLVPLSRISEHLEHATVA